MWVSISVKDGSFTLWVWCGSRYLFASRILPYIDKQDGLNTTLTNPFYLE